MKITTKQATVPSRGNVVVSPNPIRTREWLDKDGNVIDFKTKQIIRKADNNE